MSLPLSIIPVNWNSTEYVRQCVASIYENTRAVEFELIVVDNASPDGDADLLKQQLKELKLIKSPENLGFGRANNLGFKHSTGQYLLFLNPDTKLVNPAIDIMLTHLRIPGRCWHYRLQAVEQRPLCSIDLYPDVSDHSESGSRHRFPP